MGRVCGLARNSERLCTPYCPLDGYACVNDISTSCTLLDEKACRDCGCPDGLRCEPGVGCKPRSDLGGPCVKNEDCNTLNCGVRGVCQVPSGRPCDASNCDVCFQVGGWSYCSNSCYTGNDCAQGSDCFDVRCRPACYGPGACALGECRPYTDLNGGISYACVCDGSCRVTFTKLDFGQVCAENADCESDLCDSSVQLYCSDNKCPRIGQCTKECKSSNDCPGGYRCADAGGVSRCLRACTEHCYLPDSLSSFAECTPLTTTEGDSASLCWVVRSQGPCATDADCKSNKCVGYQCISADGARNGDFCSQNADCVSQFCEAGACRGASVLGDPCTTRFDCAVGTCCTSGAKAGTCQTSCPN